MNITKLVLGACSTNVYIVSSNKKNAILIDPADNAAEIIKTIEENGLCLKYIFITHGHTDHILALKEVKEYFNVPVIISKIDAGRLENEELINERPYVKIPYKAVKADILICEDDIINLDDTPDLTDFMLSAEAKTSDMFVEEFLDTFIKEYGIYVIQTRALPSIMDGLRVGARKIVYAANKNLKPNNPVKMTSLIGRVFDLNYHHGDASLQSTIEFLGSKHLFKYHPISVLGQIPSLRVSKVKTASRYLKVTKSPYFFMYEYDTELYEYKEEDGQLVEPEFLFPIVPMQLLQRTSSPGFGFAYFSFSYKLEDVIDNCMTSIMTGTCNTL
jgi:hypothetical protein